MALDAAKGQTSALTTIASDGDVIMVVGPDKHQMRVDSHCVRRASKVFDIMLGPNWSEGQELSRNSPPQVTLDEDDAEAMETIFYVLHHRNEEVPEKFSGESILEIAIASDKYDFAVALRFASAEWLRRTHGIGMIGQGYLATAAFLFDIADEFKRYTYFLMLSEQGSYLQLLKNDKISQFLPFKAIYQLEEGRNRMRTSVGDIITSAIKDCCGVSSCAWGKKRKEGYIKFLSENSASEIFKMAVADFMEKVRRATDESDMRQQVVCGSFVRHKLAYDDRVTEKIDAVRNAAGLCLDCVRTEGSCKAHK